jgi:photosystem II stability/assembly factor-like uncharacterized protein
MLSLTMLRRLAGVLGIAAGLGLFASARPADGQTPVWAPRGPTGGTVYCIVPDPSHPATLYAGTDSGVFRSDDGGTSWRAANAGISTYRVQTIAVDPVTPTTLYAGTRTPSGVASVGIFKSTDGGTTWTDDNLGLVDTFAGFAPVDIQVLSFDPRHPGTIWAGTWFSEIFESTDNGATWQAKSFGGFSIALVVWAFRFDPANPLRVVAAVSDNNGDGLLVTTDGGSTWNTLGNAGNSLFSLAADPNTPAILYAGGAGFFKSTDSGSHFTAMNKGFPSSLPFVVAIALDPTRPTTLYAATYGNGLFQSTDSAATWTPVGAPRSSLVWTVMLAPGQSSTVYAGTVGAGVYQSLDSGHTFSPSNAGLNLSLVYALAPDPTSPATVYAAAYAGAYKSTDGGDTWQAATNGLPVAPVTALLVQPGSPRTLFAGTRGGGLLKSTDGGGTWNPSAQGLNDSYVASIAVDPSSPSTLYAGTSHPDTSQSERVYKSIDGGATWSQTSLDGSGSFITSLTINPAKTSQVIAVSQGSFGYFQSLDSGKSWSNVSTDASCGGVNAVFFDSSGATEYLAGTSGLCRSTDGGKTWTVSPVAVLASVNTLLIDPSIPSIFYVGVEPATLGGTGGVFKSTDSGATWQPLGTGLENAFVSALNLNSVTKAMVAATAGNGIAKLVSIQSRPPVEPPPSGHQPRKLTPR